jgi:hypothetical protein
MESTNPPIKSSHPAESLALGAVLSAIGIGIALGADQWWGWILALVGGLVSQIGAIAWGVMVGLRRIETDRRGAGSSASES